MSSILVIINWIIAVINGYVVPLVFALAFVLFLFGVFRFFFTGVGDPKNRVEGRKFIVSAVVAFAVMVSVWGLVNIVRFTLPLPSNSMPALPTFEGGASGGIGAPAPSQPSGGGGGVGSPAPSQPSGGVGSPAPSQSPSNATCANGKCKDLQGLY